MLYNEAVMSDWYEHHEYQKRRTSDWGIEVTERNTAWQPLRTVQFTDEAAADRWIEHEKRKRALKFGIEIA